MQDRRMPLRLEPAMQASGHSCTIGVFRDWQRGGGGVGSALKI